MLDLISLGECMIEFYCDGSISKAAHFHKAYGGDTLNTVLAAARLGSRPGFISKFREYPLAPYLHEEIAEQAVDLDCGPADFLRPELPPQTVEQQRGSGSPGRNPAVDRHFSPQQPR